jgi:hypothetical protein
VVWPVDLSSVTTEIHTWPQYHCHVDRGLTTIDHIAKPKNTPSVYMLWGQASIMCRAGDPRQSQTLVIAATTFYTIIWMQDKAE